jgi:hypothetical protein
MWEVGERVTVQKEMGVCKNYNVMCCVIVKVHLVKFNSLYRESKEAGSGSSESENVNNVECGN